MTWCRYTTVQVIAHCVMSCDITLCCSVHAVTGAHSASDGRTPATHDAQRPVEEQTTGAAADQVQGRADWQ